MSALSDLPGSVIVYEVGPRDGLQNEERTVPTEVKVGFVDLLSLAGLPVIEVTSFVRPGVVPQLSDAEDVLQRIVRARGTRYTALVPNMRGLERARPYALDGIALFTAASETFSRKNTNGSIADTLDRFRPVVAEARQTGTWIRGYVSTAFGCPYEGEVPISALLDVSRALVSMSVDQLVISDTIGVATPSQVVAVLRALSDELSVEMLALHFHDTRGTALANTLAALQMGVTTFDSSAGGLGGCPYAPGATGNLATEDLVYMLHGLGIETGVSLDKVVQATSYLAAATGHTPPSRYYRAAIA